MASRTPPGPKGLPLLGSLHELRKSPTQFLTDMARYGDIAYAKLGPTRTYFVNHPDLIEEVLLGRHRDVIKDVATRALMPLIGTGLLTGEGESWLEQRRLAAPPLQPKRIAGYLDTMVACAQRTAASFRDHEVRDVHLDMGHLTLEIAGKTLLGFDPRREAERIGRILDDAMDYFEVELRTPLGMLPAHVLTPARRRVREGRLELEAMLMRIITRCRRDDAEEADHLLARLVQARDEDGEPMSDRQLIDEALTMLLAGHETTALSLTYALYLLSEHPAELARARAEVDQVLGTRPLQGSDLPRLSFLNGVIRETLRLYPPAYTIGREVVQTIELGGYEIAPGSQLLMSQCVVHRDPRFFPEPARFMPERWLSDASEQLPRFAYFPFGGGPRVCIGNHFAMMEATLVLASMLQAVDLQVVPGFKLDLEPSVTLRPKRGLRMLVRRRLPATAAAVRSAA
ncbi:MAG TPA: cytochrome P450 [Polyangiales bacterium]|nr:cytochrome P450 [Polyangiales bacterium]